MLRIRDVYPGSRILIFTHPGSRIRISDPGFKNSNKREGSTKISCHTFFCSHKFHKIVNYFIFELLQNKIWDNFQRITRLFIQKIVTKLSKIWVWDLGSGKNLSQIRDQGSKRHRTPDPDPQHCNPLKGPKREIFDSGVFAQIRPIWIGDLGTGPKNY